MDNSERTYGQGSAAMAAVAVDPNLRAFMIGVYNKVGLGLLASAAVAYLTSGVPEIRDLWFRTAPDTGRLVGLTAPGVIVVLAPVAVMLAFGLTRELDARRARWLFWSVAVSLGASLGVSFLVYTAASIATAFAAAAAGFGALSLWGYCTPRDLKPAASFWITGLVGLLAVMGLNLLLGSAVIAFVVNAVGVLIFAGLIAFDTQRLKTFYHENQHDDGRLSAGAHIGALSLYLDFVNFLQFLLFFMGGRR